MKLRNKNTGIVYEPSTQEVAEMMAANTDFEVVEEPKKRPAAKKKEKEQ